jgi:hypothetical protein
MKRLFPVLIVLLILVVGLGFYRGWFALSRSASGLGSNKVSVNLTVDPDKMKADTKMVEEKTLRPTAGSTAARK